MRPAFFILGWCFFGLGAVGAVVPGLPTVPLMLVALWAFSRSSPRFHDWLYSHPVFGPPLQQWRAHRVIGIRAKLLAAVSIIASSTYMTLFTDMSVPLKASIALLMVVGLVFILAQPSRIRD